MWLKMSLLFINRAFYSFHHPWVMLGEDYDKEITFYTTLGNELLSLTNNHWAINKPVSSTYYPKNTNNDPSLC